MWQPLLSDINSFCCWCSSNASSSDISLIKTKTTFSSNSFPQSTKITSKDSFAIKNSKNFNFLILLKFCRLLLFLLLISFVSSFSTSSSNSLTTTTQPRPSCREHLLNGNSENKILPLLSPSGTIYWLECRFPPPGPQSGRLSYQTIINNALTGQWLNFDEIKKENKQIYIQQQITNSDFLSKLIINSDECLQLINIKWLEENNLNETESVVLETFGKETLKFTRNITANINEVNTFPINSGPVIKINSPFLTKTAINFGPLICRQMLIPRPECQFELRSDKDRIRLKLSDLRKKATKISSTATLSISFRTSKPNGRLLELLDGGNGPLGALDLVDAYLLFSNHIIHPSKLLADGLWHTIHLHLHSLSVRIDNLGTSLSLRESSDSGEPKWIDILVHGEVAAIRILDSNGNDRGEEKWICNDLTNNDFLEVRQSLPQQHIFSQPAACAPSTLEQNFCNCKGPNSALIQNGGFSRNSQIAKCSLLPNDENSSVHLSRYSDRLAFLLIPMQNNNFGLKTTISVLFKSEKESGLILFGVFSPPISPTIAQQKVLLNGGILNSIGRIQVHFIDNKVFATQCLLLADGSEKCFSCFIKLNKAFGSHDQWTRISLFHQLGNNFMSVDDLVCLLSPNSAVVDPSELYRITAKNFLFVGGTFYAKNILLNKFISEKFKRDFQDNTKEKAPSLEGCIAEILINGNNLNIPQLINEQKEKAANSIINKEDLNNIFSIKLGKCGNCPNECKGAPCSRHFDLPICQCSQIYSASDKESGGNCLINKTTEKLIYNNLIEIPSSSPTLNINSIKIPIQTPSLIANGRPRIAKLNKIWILFKLPENKFNKELFLKIGSLYLNIANYGHSILLESKEYGIFEEFLIDQTIDSRLHLFSIERKINNFGANNDGNLLLIRFDNQIKYLQLEELPIFILSPSSTETFEIEVFQNKNENENLNEIINNNNNGCIEDLLFIYSTQTSNEELSSSLNDYHEINYGSKIKSKQLINFCGIRDPNIWLGNTSSWGKLSKQPYDNYINGGVEIINVDGFSVISKSSLLSRISLIITILLIILMLIALSIYLFLLFKQHLSQNSQQQQFTNHNGKLTTKLIFEQEKQPLNEKLEKDGNDNLINKNELEAPPRPPKNTLIDSTNPNGQNINEKQSNGWNNDSSSPLMSVRPLESSPRKKQILSNGREGGATPPSPLRMTPLRPQQQLKNGNSQQNFAPTTTINSSSSSPPPLPPPSSFYSDRSLSRLAPTSNNSILSGGGLFTPSSPISELTSSSISPSGDSLRDSELMRPPNIKIISSINSKRHSPIDSIAAPIACKEEL